MQAETLAELTGLAGAVVGSGVSMEGISRQRRKTARQAERTHLPGLSEVAAGTLDYFGMTIPWSVTV